MRLTLRTLLAYLDDILEPQQAKEIGTKIAQSDFASTLTSRIKDVLRRRRVLAPDLEGPGMGIDPNTVSEYLDNTLPPDAVADVERIFLESDVHLAEVAAAHQVLTLVLGEPVEIVPESRERMYALGPEPAHDAETVAAMEGNGRRPSTARPSRPEPAPEKFEIPAYLRRKPLWKRAFPYVAVLAVAAAFGGVVLTDPSLLSIFTGETTTRDKAPDQVVAQNDGDDENKEPAADNDRQRKPAADSEKPVPDKKKPGEDDLFPPIVPGINGEPPDDEPENGRKPDDEQPKIVDQKPPVPAKKAPVGKKPPEDEQDPKEKVVAGDFPSMEYVQPDGKGLLFRYVAEPGKEMPPDWHLLAAATPIAAGDVVAAAPPFDARLQVSESCEVDLLAGTAVEVLPPSRAAVFGFEMRRGRIVVRGNSKRKGGGDQPGGVVLGVRAGQSLFRVELLTPDSVCGIDVHPVHPAAFEQKLGADSYVGALYVSAGSVRISDGNDNVAVVAAAENTAGRISLTPADRSKPGTFSSQQGAVPSWMTAAAREPNSVEARYAELYLNEFPNNGQVVKGQDPVSLLDNVTAIVRDRRAYVSQFAVESLALTESLPELVDALSVAQHEESRRAAIDGLRSWLGRHSDQGEVLQAELRKNFTEDDARAVYTLLWGFNAKDARDAGTSQQLVDWLLHNHLAVRELAFLHVQQLTDRTYDYRPNLQGTNLRLTVNRWNSHLNKNDGALLPPEEGSDKN